MNDDSSRNLKPAPGWRGLWSRIAPALARLAPMPVEEATPGAMADRQPAGDAPETQHQAAPPDRFAKQLFANLLLELPQHRQAFTSAWLASDWQLLADCAHQLAGAVAYCDLPDLGTALAGLRSAIRDGDELALQLNYNQVSREIDELLEKSGLRES